MVKEKEKDKITDVVVSRGGNQVVLPDGMTFDEGITWLQRKKEEENLRINPIEVFDCFPLDGAVQLRKALKEVFGWTQLLPTLTWFGEIPPAVINVQTGPDNILDIERVPWGLMTVPKLKGGGKIATGAVKKDGRWCFQLSGEIRQGEKTTWELIVNKVKELVRDESIYKGKALRIESFGSDKFDPHSGTPKYMQLSHFTKSDLVLPLAVKKDVAAAIFTLIERADEAKSLGIPTKRAIILAGRPGVGKTLTATIAAPLCVKHGRTMAYVTNPELLTQTIRFLRPYGRSMVFVEDIDRIAGGEERTDAINDLLNTIDGVDTKESDILFVLTTNYPERLNQAFKRNGRSDWIINIPAPDGLATAELIRMYGKNVLDITDAEALEVGEFLAEVEMIPASIAEVVQRAKSYALESSGPDDIISITRDDLMYAARGVKEHVRMMNEVAIKPKKMVPLGTVYAHEKWQNIIGYDEDTIVTDIYEVNGSGEPLKEEETA